MQDTESEAAADRDAAPLPELPYLAPWYRVAHDGDRLVLSYAHGAVVLEGRAVELLMPVLLPLLDGTRTLTQIEQQVGQAAAPAVRNALGTLASHGVLSEGPPLEAGTDAAAVSSARLVAAASAGALSETASREALRQAAVSVLGQGETAAELLRQLRRSGVDAAGALDWDAEHELLQGTELVIAAPEPSELPKLTGWNEMALRTATNWLQVLPFDGRIAAVGPLYIPGHSCCYECYQRRRAANLSVSERDFWALEETPAAYPQAPALQAVAAGIATTLVLRWIGESAGGRTGSFIPGAMHAIEWDAGIDVQRHFVFRVPRCHACFGERGMPSPWHS